MEHLLFLLPARGGSVRNERIDRNEQDSKGEKTEDHFGFPIQEEQEKKTYPDGGQEIALGDRNALIDKLIHRIELP